MKKLFLILMFIASPALAVDVTPEDIATAKGATLESIQAAQDMLAYLTKMESLVRDGYRLTVQDSTTTVLIPLALRTQIGDVTRYRARLQRMDDARAKFP
jgi:hypothetical protein